MYLLVCCGLGGFGKLVPWFPVHGPYLFQAQHWWWTVGGYHGYHLVAGDKRVLPGGIVAPKPILIIADEFKCG